MNAQEREQAEAALPFGNFERAVFTLISSGGERLGVTGLTRAASSFTYKRKLGNIDIVLLRGSALVGPGAVKRLRALMKSARARPLDVVVIGGDAAVKKALKKARPLYTGKGIGLLHIDDQGDIFESSVIAADDLLTSSTVSLPDKDITKAQWDRLLDEQKVNLKAMAAQHQEHREFVTLVKKRRPVATYALMGLIGVVFVVELALGGPELPPVLVRLGALLPERVAQGEWWRLISCTFLHASWAHIGFNVYVLFALGSFLERIIGSARFLAVYTAAALCGSLASSAFIDANMSVGASGAVWGLLGAHAVLAYRSQGLLPQAMIAGAKKAAMFNLVLNVANSFRPNVDMWAHFGGGAAGGLLVVTGAVTLGIPRLGSLEQADSSRGETADDAAIPTSNLWRFVSAGCAVVLLSGPVAAMIFDHPLALKSAPTFSDTDIAELGVRLPLPQSTPRAYLTAGVPGEAPAEAVYGTLNMDPFVVSVSVSAISPDLDPAAARQSLKEQSVAPKGATAAAPPIEFDANGAPGVCHYYRYAQRLVLDRCFLVWPGRILRVETMRWDALEQAAPNGVAKKMLDGASPIDLVPIAPAP